MAKTRRVEGPAGALADDDLQRWLEGARAGLGADGISATFGRAPRIGGVPGPTWVSMTSATAHGRLVRSTDGATVVTVHALPDSATLLAERHPSTTLAQLEALVEAMGAHRPIARRA
jgi:hypothetical protein